MNSKNITSTIAILLMLLSCKPQPKGAKINADPNPYDFGVEGVHAAFYNTEGDRISMSTTYGRLFLVDTALTILDSTQAHEGRATSCFFSFDGRSIITGGEDSLLKIWNAGGLNLNKSYDIEFYSHTSVIGLQTLGSCGSGGAVIMYNEDGQDTVTLQLEEEGADFLFYVWPDSVIVISSGLHGYEIDIPRREVTRKYAGHTNRVHCIMASNDRTRVVTASADSTVKIFDRRTEKLLHTTEKLDGMAYVACFSHSDDLIAASTSSGTIYFLDTTLSQVRSEIHAFDTRINTIHYSPDGKRMVAGSEGWGAKIFDTRTGALLHSLKFSSVP